ncbi:MAG TPA: tannase/feruloyl esterase family alpha/beta hydrolase, partial [Candidatus Limnocylindria bacterium]|nr:tannase/feruloyl esterase family alpha/beta hydrolase [Candidatus Limnocylindria bacterium]
FSEVIGTENADLTAFAKAGGKVVIWHGLADQLIFPQGTIDYYQRVQSIAGGDKKTQEFARLFLAPGVAHCAGGPGPQPDSPLNAVVDWVENGNAPATLSGVVKDPTGAVKQTRPICMYPAVAAYKGAGDTAAASSFACQTTATK